MILARILSPILSAVNDKQFHTGFYHSEVELVIGGFAGSEVRFYRKNFSTRIRFDEINGKNQIVSGKERSYIGYQKISIIDELRRKRSENVFTHRRSFAR